MPRPLSNDLLQAAKTLGTISSLIAGATCTRILLRCEACCFSERSPACAILPFKSGLRQKSANSTQPPTAAPSGSLLPRQSWRWIGATHDTRCPAAVTSDRRLDEALPKDIRRLLQDRQSAGLMCWLSCCCDGGWRCLTSRRCLVPLAFGTPANDVAQPERGRSFLAVRWRDTPARIRVSFAL